MTPTRAEKRRWRRRVRRVSMALNKLKREGRAQFHESLGQSQRFVWAGTDDAGRELRDRRLEEVREASGMRPEQEAALHATMDLSRAWERLYASAGGAEA